MKTAKKDVVLQETIDLLAKERHAREIAEAKLRMFIDALHELRTPLTLITTPLHSLLKEDDDPHRRGLYETMRRNAERILRLGNQLTEIDLLEHDVIKMHMCETDLISFVGDALALYSQEAKAKMIFLNYYHDMETLPVWLDRTYFEKVIVNIVYNAFKYTPVGGIIDLTVKQDDSRAYIIIHDTGIGIPEDKLASVFNPFYDAHLSLEERNVGTGIGLDLIHRLIQLHHGSISVRNNTDGHGCEFTITLPLGCAHLSEEEMLQVKEEVNHFSSQIDVSEWTGTNSSASSRQSKKQRIVLVENETDVSDFLMGELADDYHVTLCKKGSEGLAAVGSTNPDLIISDVKTDDIEGQALCSRIKANSLTSHIPVILLTTPDPNQDRLELLEAAADAYIMRPFNMDILRRTIVNLLHRQHTLKLKYGRNEQLEEMVDDIQMKSPDDKLLERLMVVINKNLNNTDLNVDQIAAAVGISRVHLHRKMKKLTGQTPHDFIRGLRLKRAAQLLSQGDMSVIEVVYACGFGSAANFSTVFKKTYGISPSKYMDIKKEAAG